MANKLSVIVAALILAAGIAVSGISIGESIKYFRNFDRFVEVKGLAERYVKADQASWQIGFTASGNDLKDIYQSIDNEQQIVTGFLVQQGFSASEITKQPISVIDNYANAYGGGNVKLSHYNANAGIIVTSKAIDKVEKSVQQTNKLIEQGVLLNNNNVAYSYTGLNDIKASMLNDALSNAKIAADEFAKKSNSKLDKIKSASQGLFTITGDNNMQSDSNSINKKVRVVTTVQFFLR